jgi:hypothetical protein
MSTSRLPQREHTSLVDVVSAPYRSAISAASRCTRWPHALHHTISRTRATAAFPGVIGGPNFDYMVSGRCGSIADKLSPYEY